MEITTAPVQSAQHMDVDVTGLPGPRQQVRRSQQSSARPGRLQAPDVHLMGITERTRLKRQTEAAKQAKQAQRMAQRQTRQPSVVRQQMSAQMIAAMQQRGRGRGRGQPRNLTQAQMNLAMQQGARTTQAGPAGGRGRGQPRTDVRKKKVGAQKAKGMSQAQMRMLAQRKLQRAGPKVPPTLHKQTGPSHAQPAQQTGGRASLVPPGRRTKPPSAKPPTLHKQTGPSFVAQAGTKQPVAQAKPAQKQTKLGTAKQAAALRKGLRLTGCENNGTSGRATSAEEEEEGTDHETTPRRAHTRDAPEDERPGRTTARRNVRHGAAGTAAGERTEKEASGRPGYTHKSPCAHRRGRRNDAGEPGETETTASSTTG